MPRLNQIIAIEKPTKSDALRRFTDLHRATQKPALLTGIARVYEPKDEDGDQLPPESTKVQLKIDEVLDDVAATLTRLFDVVATKDLSNCFARADVVINGEALLSDVPVSTLLFLEKQLADIGTFVEKLPQLDPAETWRYDAGRGCYATEPAKTTRSKKIPRNHVLAEATAQHPAQVTVWHEDVLVGQWTTVKLSGALPTARVAALIDRVNMLRDAVKTAREAANSIEARTLTIGRQVFEYLFED